MTISPFDFINSINSTKEDLMVDDQAIKDYNPFIVNKGLSYFADTIYDSQMMNLNSHLPKDMQYKYLINSVRPRKRYSKWFKRDDKLDADLTAIRQYYGYDISKAKTALSILSEEQLNIIKQKLETGGIK